MNMTCCPTLHSDTSHDSDRKTFEVITSASPPRTVSSVASLYKQEISIENTRSGISNCK